MRHLFEEIQEALDYLLQSGYSSVLPVIVQDFITLGIRCEDCGLHTGAELMKTLGRLLEAREHTIKKDDLALTDALCRSVRYISLCREYLDIEETTRRWKSAADGMSE